MIPISTRREIDNVVKKTLRDAGMSRPPIVIEDLLDYLQITREFHQLEDPGFIDKFLFQLKRGKQRLIVEGKKIAQSTGVAKIFKKLKLGAFWFPDQERIVINASLPEFKQLWASFHDTIHTLLEWHRQFFIGDTIKSLEPDYQEMLESEANYGCSALMFGGEIFTREALDLRPCWNAVDTLKKRHKKSYQTTLRRFVCFSHKIPLAMMVSTPDWEEKSADQENRWRHFVPSGKFFEQFSSVSPENVLEQIDDNTYKRRGGPVGDFEMLLMDNNGQVHVFAAESFYNTHDILTLIAYKNRLKTPIYL